ncbi:MAG TPA: RimK/LysX family protein [Acidobacteriota bacterium]|nr:RimK/LysX family protein [Acidobacteriota bacterium]
MAGSRQSTQLVTVGWREWVELPELGIPAIKAKVDTGARTSALHAFRLETFDKEGVPWARFWMHPLQKNSDIERCCEARIIDQRPVTDSGGHREDRLVISSPLRLGDHQWDIEITLTNRETMLFRMLLGRTALRGRLQVDPSKSFLFGKRQHVYDSEIASKDSSERTSS